MPSYESTTQTTVCGGFPIVVHFYVHPAEPAVGYLNDYCELNYITTPRGHPCPWLERKFTDADNDAINVAMHENMERDDGY